MTVPECLSPVPCIIDTDPGVDDVVALLLALASPELLVLSITLTHGNTPLSATIINLRKMFYALEKHLEENPHERAKWPGLDMDLRNSFGAGKILVLLGSDVPLDAPPVTAKYFHGKDGLSNVTDRHPELTPPDSWESPYFTLSDRSMTVALPELMLDWPPSTIAYLALGPLTSLAKLHSISPVTSFLHHFALILVMGGAVDVPGNTTPVAEFNSYACPHSAKQILDLNLPHLYLLPLDITTPHNLPFELYKSLVDSSFEDTKRPSQPGAGKSPLVHFTSSFLEGTRETVRRYHKDWMEMHDPTVVWALIDWSRDGQQAIDQEAELANHHHLTDPEGMRRRLEENGFSRRVVERRRSSDLRLRARLERERDNLSRLRVVEVPGDVEEGDYEDDEDDVLEADEQGDPREVVTSFHLLHQQQQDVFNSPRPQYAGEGEGTAGEGEQFGWQDDERLAPGWEWVRREFEVETTGTITRGMYVTDRRASAAIAKQSGSSRSTNRAVAVEENEQLKLEGPSGSPVTPQEEERGTKVVVATPGGDTLRAVLLERIWGVSIGLA
ncbi:nucleoside hydrolase [Meredithblackwellia eburnea MCA 4105]